jgi:hydroxymethylbilane synthase
MDQPPQKIRLGTRGSRLALTQSTQVARELERLGAVVELIEIKTMGDVHELSLTQIGGQGVFTKQLQIALLEREIDLAVHSLKDLPTADHPDLQIAAIPLRENRADALISLDYPSLDQLPAGAVVGTGSVRRSAQLRRIRPDLIIRDIRGNVDTRIRKLQQGEFQAIVLAVAGLQRMGLQDHICQIFPTAEFFPAVGQGALGLEIRAGDLAVERWVAQLNHPASYYSAMAERALLRKLFSGCLSAVGADSKIEGDQLQLRGIVLSRDGREAITAADSTPLTNAVALGERVAEKLLESGAQTLLDSP